MENNYDNRFIDPSVNQLKWEEELQTFSTNENAWRLKGVFLIKKSFPLAEFLFTTSKTTPHSVGFAVRIDFNNYDILPLSVKFIDPFTGNLLKRSEVKMRFFQVIVPPGFQPNHPLAAQMIQPRDILQSVGPDDIPFICLPGFREYHDHPRHTGDSWFLYRDKGEGRLGYILEQLYNHSIGHVSGLNVQLQPVVDFKFNVEIPVQ